MAHNRARDRGTIRRRRVLGAILSTGLIAAASGAQVAHAEEHTIRATAPWVSRARVFVTGRQQGFLLGVLAGRLLVEQKPSPSTARSSCARRRSTRTTADDAARGRALRHHDRKRRSTLRPVELCGRTGQGCAGRFVLLGGRDRIRARPGTVISRCASISPISPVSSSWRLSTTWPGWPPGPS